MTADEIRSLVNQLSVWRKGDQRAPHKPLLLLLALGRCLRGEPRLASYSEVDPPLRRLLADFGPPRRSIHPEFPFWYLQNDGLWELAHSDRLVVKSRRSPSKGKLLEHDIQGGFSEPVQRVLKDDPALVAELAGKLLETHFPATLHGDILQAVGIDLDFPAGVRRSRDPEFRSRVLRAYEYRCAVCGFDVRMGASPVALEAAHIQWHQAGGPDIENNGIALCVLHHRLFDRGAFALVEGMRLVVSEEAYGTAGFEEWLLRFHGAQLRPPQGPDYYPEARFTDWHVREVFRGRFRYLEDNPCTSS